VTMITGHYDLGGLEPNKTFVQRQTIDGIEVVVVGTRYSNKQSYLRRIVSFLSFMFFSVYVGLGIKKVDAIYATSTPLTVGIPAMILKFLKRVPFVFEVRDQWPEIPIELGIIKSRILIIILLWLEKTIYRNSSRIIALSPGQADGIRKVLADHKEITVIPNSSDTDVFRPGIDGSAVRKQYGWADKFVLLHAGAMGTVNHLDFIIDAAERLKDHDDILFVLIGEGKQKSALQYRVSQLGLTNVQISSAVPKHKLAEVLAAADVGLVIIGDFPIIEHNSANKFFDSLSAGKPVLLNYSGWQRKILEENAAGLGCQLCNMDEFVEKVLYLNSHRQESLDMGRNARDLAKTEFSRDRWAAKALDLIGSIV
jgi:glycosyltransferase involved in cell wall biosynthesis